MIPRTLARALSSGLVATFFTLLAANARAQTQPASPAGTSSPKSPTAAAPASPAGTGAAPKGSGSNMPTAPAGGAAPSGSPSTSPAPSSSPPGAPVGGTLGAAAPAQRDSGRPLLAMDEAVRLFDKNGFDLLLADAQIAAANADKLSLVAIPNPGLSASVGKAFNYDPGTAGTGASDWGFGVGVTDNAAVARLIAGKVGLRKDVAEAAIAATKMSKEDARRTLQTQVKGAYIEAARATAALDLAKQTQESAARTLDLNQTRLRAGAIDDGVLARVETAKLQADVAVDQAEVAVEAAKTNLRFFLGQGGVAMAEFDVDADAIKPTTPARLANATYDSLVREARDHRPDLRAVRALRQHAESSIELAKRERIPDLSLGLNYNQMGTGQNALQPPSLTFGVSLPLPIFYQNQGDIAHGEADLFQQTTQEKKTLALIDTDVRGAFAQYTTLKRIVERYDQGGLIDRARKAKDITEKQFNLGAAPLMDFLDAKRTFISVSNDQLVQEAAYWNAVFALEQAVGEDLRH